jgi:hypothetical protein
MLEYHPLKREKKIIPDGIMVVVATDPTTFPVFG